MVTGVRARPPRLSLKKPEAPRARVKGKDIKSVSMMYQ